MKAEQSKRVTHILNLPIPLLTHIHQLTNLGSAGRGDSERQVPDVVIWKVFQKRHGAISSVCAITTVPIVVTNSSGKATVTLTLPSSAGTVHVTAQGPYGLGHPTAAFTETAQ